jgi:type 1 glutamine amidotransferase
MRKLCLVFAAAVVAVFSITSAAPSSNAPTKSANAKKLLLVTHSGDFVHDSVGFAEEILKKLGPSNGFEVTCWRYTGDPKDKGFEKYCEKFRARTGVVVTPESCGRVNKETLKNFDCVLFFTTGSFRNLSPLTKDELADLENWVKDGGAFAGTHCATDTLYDTTYGALVGGYFDGHPWTKKIKVKVEDPKHAAAAGFETGAEIDDEIYQFKDSPYSREKLHIILSVDNSSIDVSKGARKDQDYAISWCQEYGKGRSFYTSLGHRKEVWKDERFQKHLIGGLKWAMKDAEGSAAPSGKP